MLKPRSVQHKVNQESYALLISTLIDSPCSTSKLCEVTGLSRVVVQNIGRCFVKHGLVHVGAWTTDARGVYRLPIWNWGPGLEAPRPPPKTPAQIKRAYDLRRKQAKAGGVAGTVFASIVGALVPPK